MLSREGQNRELLIILVLRDIPFFNAILGRGRTGTFDHPSLARYSLFQCHSREGHEELLIILVLRDIPFIHAFRGEAEPGALDHPNLVQLSLY
jgi:hypothetical protein